MSSQFSLISSDAKPGLVLAGIYNVSPPAPVDGQACAFQTDSNGNLLVNVAVGGGGGAGNITQWGSVAVAAAATTSPVGTEAAPVVRNISKKTTTILTTTPLTANQVYTSAWFDSQQTGTIWVELTILVPTSTATTLQVQGSDDINNASFTKQISATNGAVIGTVLTTLKTYISTRYWRVTVQAPAGGEASIEITATEYNTPPPILFGASGADTRFLDPVGVSSNGSVQTSIGFGANNAIESNINVCSQPASGGGVSVPAVVTAGLSGGQGTATFLTRIPNIFKTAQATASGNTALWTPTSGKKFRLMRFMVQVTGNALTSGGAVITVSFQDSSSALNIAMDVFVPASTAFSNGDDFISPWVDLGNGFLSAAANNVLNVNLSAALTAGNVRVTCCGTEE